MSVPAMMRTAAEAANEVVRRVRPEQLALPTPCPEWDVRALINHLLTWSAHASEQVARRQPVDVAALMSTDFMTGGWAKDYAAQVDKAAEAWAAPRALDGQTSMGGGPPRPAAELAGMFLSELVVHGWDLARATGQGLRIGDDLASAVLGINARMAAEARELRLFGEPVPVGPDASPLDRAIAVTGRDPRWAS